MSVGCRAQGLGDSEDRKGLWPEKADTNRLLGGVAYGAWLRTGVRVGNSIGAFDHAILFRALKTGVADGFQIHNRTPSNADFTNAGGNPANRWSSFQIAGTYRYGNGGTYEPALHKCDENGDIGELIQQGDAYELWPLSQAGNVPINNPYRGANWPTVAGEWYWLVLENLTPPPGLAPVSAAVAQSWGNGVGYTTINGNQRPEAIPGCPNFAGVIGGDGYIRHLYKNGGTSWNEWTREDPYFQLHYTDGQEVGDVYAVLSQNGDYTGSPTEFIHEVQGTRRVRQRIRFPYAATTFDRVEVYHGHRGDLPAPNGSPLIVQIKALSGAVLATAQIPPKQIVWQLSRGGDGLPNAARDGRSTDTQRRIHQWATLDQPVTLQPGQDYFYELSAAAGANFRVPSMLVANSMKPQATREYLVSPNEFAEWSDNSGASWQAHSNSATFTKDLPVILICQGVPLDANEVITGP